jgi:phosphohistidine phosphatase
MKILYLVRHAKAISADVGVTDFKRALTKTGRNDARSMGKKLRKKAIEPELLISSPADRTLETAHIFAKKLGYPPQKIWLKEEIYDEDAEALQELIKQIDDKHTTVMFFGHNPSVSDLAKAFLPDLETDIQVAGILGIAFETSSWRDISAESATLLLFDFPVQVTPKIYKKARRNLTAELESTIGNLLGDKDAETSKQLEKIVRKTSKQLAKKFIKMLPESNVEDVAGTRKCIRIDNLPPEGLQVAVMSPSQEEWVKDTVEVQIKEKVEVPVQEPPTAEVTEKKIEEPPKETPTAKRARKTSSSAKKTTGTKKQPSRRRTTKRRTTSRTSTKKTS